MTMLRSILRNVQYYLLFFSLLLVLLAFQRLQWYDQGLLPNPYAFNDRPHGRGFTSPDNAGRVYYGGDESKEIGLFKFRLGLFNFAFPTFSNDNAPWERSTTVPPPPNKRRKSTENLYSRLKAQSRLHSKSREEQGETEQKGTSRYSVAYVVVLPKLQHPFKFQRRSSTKDNDEGNILEGSFYNRSKVLSQSIGRAHTNSPYEYQLYALSFHGASGKDSDWGKESLFRSGFKIINVGVDELGKVGNEFVLQSNRKLRNIDKQQHNVLQLLNDHDVIVHMSLNSFLLKPMNDLFDVLLKGGNTNKVAGVVEVEPGSTGEEKSDGKFKRDGPKVNLFALEPFHASAAAATSPIERNELIIFRSSSKQATDAYLKRLKCASIELLPKEQSNGKHMKFYPKLRTSVVKEIDLNSNQQELECTMQIERGLRLLDRCIYDVGNFDAGHDCSHVSITTDARVSRFPEGRATAVDTAGMLRVERAANNSSNDGQNGNGHCVKPWERSIMEDCSKDDDSRKEEEICTWLCTEWLSLVK